MVSDAQLEFKPGKKNATTRSWLSPCQDSSTRETMRLVNNNEARVVPIRNLQQDRQEDLHPIKNQKWSLLNVFNKTNKENY